MFTILAIWEAQINCRYHHISVDVAHMRLVGVTFTGRDLKMQTAQICDGSTKIS